MLLEVRSKGCKESRKRQERTRLHNETLKPPPPFLPLHSSRLPPTVLQALRHAQPFTHLWVIDRQDGTDQGRGALIGQNRPGRGLKTHWSESTGAHILTLDFYSLLADRWTAVAFIRNYTQMSSLAEPLQVVTLNQIP